MQIYILDSSWAKCAEYLDDKSLNEQIEAIAYALCNVHHKLLINYYGKDKDELWTRIPLNYKNEIEVFSEWASTSIANYRWLVDLLRAHLYECHDRFLYKKLGEGIELKDLISSIRMFYRKYHDDVFLWLAKNEPSLSDIGLFSFPVCIPDKFIVTREVFVWPNGTGIAGPNIIESYRNYFRSEVKDPQYTRREPPKWLEDEL